MDKTYYTNMEETHIMYTYNLRYSDVGVVKMRVKSGDQS